MQQFTDNTTVSLVIEATDAQSGVKYIIVSDNATTASEIGAGSRNVDNLTSEASSLAGTDIITVGDTEYRSDNGSQIILDRQHSSENYSGNVKRIYVWVADGAKTIRQIMLPTASRWT